MNAPVDFVTSFAYNFSGQLVARIFSFCLNLYLFRKVDKDVLGVANVRLTLLYTTILFLVREPFRKACIGNEATSKDKKKGSKGFKDLVLLLWLGPLICTGASVILSIIWLAFLSRPDPVIIPGYDTAVCAFTLAAFLEILAEPFWILAQKFGFVKFVALTQASHILFQRVLIVCFASLRKPDLYAYSISMILASLFYLAIFTVYFYFILKFKPQSKKQQLESIREECGVTRISDLLPSKDYSLDSDRLKLVWSFFKHSITKQSLTEGAQYIMTFLNVLDFGQQAIFDAIDRLGSLVARIVFAPLEETAYHYFSKNMDSFRDKDSSHLEEDDRKKLNSVREVLTGLLKILVIGGLLVCVCGYSYSYIVLRIYGGDKLASPGGTAIMRFYCAYIFLLALNGITECFIFAVMSKEQVTSHRNFLIVSSLISLLLHATLSKSFGGVGFVLANSVNMVMRIGYSCQFIDEFWQSRYPSGDDDIPRTKTFSGLVPELYVFGLLACCFLATAVSEMLFCCDGVFNTMTHLIIGALSVLFYASTIYTRNQSFFNHIIKFLGNRHVD